MKQEHELRLEITSTNLLILLADGKGLDGIVELDLGAWLKVCGTQLDA